MNSYDEFRRVVSKEREYLTQLSDIWNSKVNCDKSFSKEIQGRIRAAVGKTRLLLAEKFKQFEGLIDQSENNTSEKEILINDLQGFWDLVLIQVNEVKEIFRDLEEIRMGKVRGTVKKVREYLKNRDSDARDSKSENAYRKKSLSGQADDYLKRQKDSVDEEKTRPRSGGFKNNISISKKQVENY